MFLKKIVDNYKFGIKKIIRTMTGSNNEDIEQEVYIRTWKNLLKYEKNGSFKGWINKIAVNICRDYLKSREFKVSRYSSPIEELSELKDEKRCNPEIQLISKQDQERILKSIDKLKPKYKQVVLLYEMHGLNYEEIAEKLKCPVGTVKSRLYNARQILSEELKDML